MTSPAAAPAPDRPAQADGLAWHVLTAERVLQAEEVDGLSGLSSAEVAARAERFGPNKFAEGRTESRWHAFFRQYTDLMQIVLLAAGVISLYPLKELETGILLIALTLFNAVLGLRQEGKAAAAVAALQKMRSPSRPSPARACRSPRARNPWAKPTRRSATGPR